MKRRDSFLLCFCFCLSLAWAQAGVVEDAEEELKKMRESRGEVLHQTSPGFDSSAGYPLASPDSAQSRGTDSRPDSRADGEAAKTGSSGRETGASKASFTEEDKAAEQVGNRPRKRDRSDRNLSILGILLFLALIIAGAAYGSRSQAES